MTPEQWFAAADQFMESAHLIKLHEKDSGVVLVIPQVTALSFASEAYLKCLLTIRERHFPPDHDLHMLFGRLPPEDKEAIEAVWNAGTLPNVINAAKSPPPDLDRPIPTTLNQCLKASANAFKEWRYRTRHTMFWFLGNFPVNVRDRILRTRPGWASRPPNPFPGDPQP